MSKLPTFQSDETLAERRGVPYQRLMQIWLLDMLRQEAPDLLPQSYA
jgi:hypothetical protein